MWKCSVRSFETPEQKAAKEDLLFQKLQALNYFKHCTIFWVADPSDDITCDLYLTPTAFLSEQCVPSSVGNEYARWVTSRKQRPAYHPRRQTCQWWSSLWRRSEIWECCTCSCQTPASPPGALVSSLRLSAGGWRKNSTVTELQKINTHFDRVAF